MGEGEVGDLISSLSLVLPFNRIRARSFSLFWLYSLLSFSSSAGACAEKSRRLLCRSDVF